MPVLVDVNEPSQLPRQPHLQQQQQSEQQQRAHCSSSSSSTRRQPLVGIENTETFTVKEKEESTSPSVHANDSHTDSKENCPPPPKAARKPSRSTVLVKGIESMPIQTFSIVLPSGSGGGDTSAKSGTASPLKVELEVEVKANKALKAKVNKGERRDTSKETSRVDLESTRGRGGRGDSAGVHVAVVSLTDSMSQSGEPVTTTTTTTTTTTVSADIYRKPDISYSHLILHAISQSPNERLTLREIYAWIETRHPFYRETPSGWQVTSATKRKGQQAMSALVFFLCLLVYSTVPSSIY
jgi:hypothetical protein